MVTTNYKNIKVTGKTVAEVMEKINNLIAIEEVREIRPRRNKE